MAVSFRLGWLGLAASETDLVVQVLAIERVYELVENVQLEGELLHAMREQPGQPRRLQGWVRVGLHVVLDFWRGGRSQGHNRDIGVFASESANLVIVGTADVYIPIISPRPGLSPVGFPLAHSPEVVTPCWSDQAKASVSHIKFGVKRRTGQDSNDSHSLMQ